MPSSSSRLTVVCVASLAMLAIASAALAQAGPTAGAAGSPRPGAADSDATRTAPGPGEQHTLPSGCPYRNGKLELIV